MPGNPLRSAADEPIRFFLAGPTYVLQAVRAAQLRPPVGHRAAEFRATYERIAGALQPVFRTTCPVVIATGSATLLMEAAVASTVGTRVLHLVNGAFSGRFHTIAQALGREADQVVVPTGHAIDPELLRQALRRRRYDAVTVVHSETSTGVLNPLADLARVLHEESDALLVVDTVSSLGGAAVETDAWGLDVVLTAAQKALAMPPGLSFAAVSARAEERMTGVARRGFYTDLRRYLDKHREGGTITTPAVTLLWAAEAQLAAVLAEGIEKRWARHGALHARMLAWATSRGLPLPADARYRSPTVTALGAPPHLAAPELVKALAARGYTVSEGYGDWKARTFRIGHMGEVQPADLEGLLGAIDELIG
ncbi:MAG TPA: alanine--glyoxylate aminotransferase family protein [Thermoanaerobaculia bacterium]|jgi:predicted phosphoserine aminotransferase|nr:alanine--glyoxylate aminotransferase family protein [Thermoanaerobaculia bacterium]